MDSVLEGLKRSQRKFIAAFQSGKYRYLCGAGTTGSGKSIVMIALLHFLCMFIPGVRFAIFRKSEKNLKHTTIPSYKKVKALTKSVGVSVITDMSAKYHNGSEILFIWADITKDPECDNVKGLELTGALFEEANQIHEKYFSICKTRIGRWNNEKVKPFILVNLNPSLGWCRDVFYDPYVNGTLADRHYFQQFDVEDAKECVGLDYISGLEDLPEEEYNRYVMNLWDYSDIPNQLIKYEWYKQCLVDDYEIGSNDRGLLAVDPAWEGKDETVFGRMHGDHIGWWEIYPKQDPDDSGALAVERAREFSIKQKDVIIDPIGVGASTVLHMRKQEKFYPSLFNGGESPVKDASFLKMHNLRSEGHWLLREAMRNSDITFKHNLKFQKQCLALKYSVTDKVVKILDKKAIIKETKESPGLSDVAVMLVHRKVTTSNDLYKKLTDRQTKKKFKIGSSRAERERASIIKSGAIR